MSSLSHGCARTHRRSLPTGSGTAVDHLPSRVRMRVFVAAMVSAYRRMAECMPENGIQVIMFTHQSGSIWADMANIVWASGLHVTAAWYVVTETESALREGSYVKEPSCSFCVSVKGRSRPRATTLPGRFRKRWKRRFRRGRPGSRRKGTLSGREFFKNTDIQMAGYAAACATHALMGDRRCIYVTN